MKNDSNYPRYNVFILIIEAIGAVSAFGSFLIELFQQYMSKRDVLAFFGVLLKLFH